MINTTEIIPIIGIYKITNPKGKIYIGQSINIIRRFNQYKLLKNCFNQKILINSLKKYTPECHKFEILEKCNKEDLNIKERFWQDQYNVIGPMGLNCILTNTKELPKIYSEETRNKLRYPKTEEYKQKMRKPQTEEHKNSLSAVRLGKPQKGTEIFVYLNNNFIGSFISVSGFCKIFKLKSVKNITRCIDKEDQKAYGYHFFTNKK
jgi:group I intron endonuclease